MAIEDSSNAQNSPLPVSYPEPEKCIPYPFYLIHLDLLYYYASKAPASSEGSIVLGLPDHKLYAFSPLPCVRHSQPIPTSLMCHP